MIKALFPFLLMIATVPLHAAIHIWTGAASERFSDASNWRGGSPAGDPDAELVFPPGQRLAITNDIPALTVRLLSITGPGYTIGGLPLTLANDAEVTDSSLGPTTIACDVHIANGATFFSISSDYDDGLIFSGSISGAGPVVKRGHGRMTFSGARANTYAGATDVREGELRLGKSDGVDAIGGDLVIENAAVTTLANEQIPDSVTIHISGNGDLDIGAIETVGPLELEGGADIGTAVWLQGWNDSGTLILSGDVHILPGFDSVQINGDFALAGIRTFTNCETCTTTELRGLRDHTPGSGLILRGGPFEVGDSHYLGPTRIEGAHAVVVNPQTTVRLRGGSFAGEVDSLVVEEGTLYATRTPIVIHRDLILNAATTVRLDVEPRVSISVAGTVNLGGAALVIDRSPFGRTLGRAHQIIVNQGTDAIRGMFSGVPEGAVIHRQLRVTYAGNDGNDVVFTEVGQYPTGVHLRATPDDDLAFGETLTLIARVHANFGLANGGSVTFREGDLVIGTAAVGASGEASIALQPSWGRHTYTARYEGTDVYAPSEATADVDISPPPATITSTDPATVSAGTTATVIVYGSNFLPGGSLYIGSSSVPFTYVSSSELRLTWNVPRYEQAEVTTQVVYLQPQPGYVSSNQFPIVVKGGGPTKPAFTFEQKAIVAPVTPGGGSAWISVAQRYVPFTTRIEQRTAITSDTDHDGLARWEVADDVPPAGLWLMTDMTDGRVLASARNDAAPPPSPIPAAMFLRDEQGRYAHIVMQEPFFEFIHRWEVLWVRPGVGAWTTTLQDGGERDRDGMQNGYAVHHVSQMRAVGNSPAAPAGFERGDVLAGIDWSLHRWFGDRVDSHLDEADGAGTLRLYHPHLLLEGVTPVARFVVLRVGGSDGTVSVNYSTVNDTALAGVHYEARAGTLTFGPGEIVKTVDVPLIDDEVFSGNTTLKLALSQPAGTTITGLATGSLEVRDDDPAPYITASDVTVTEGDHGRSEVQFPVHITGATRVPVRVTWNYSSPPYHQWFSGALTFLPGGPSTQTFTIAYDANATPEDDRRIFVELNFYDGVSSDYLDRTVTIVDDDLARVTILDATVSESKESVMVTLAMVTLPLTTHSQKTVTIDYATADGSATAGTDFTGTAGTVTLRAFQNQTTIEIPIVRDTDAEGDEWFSLVLSDPHGATLRRTAATVIILDDDSNAMPAITATSPVTAEESGEVTFRFRLSFPATHEVRFRATTVAGTAAAGDFVTSDHFITIPAGATDADLSVRLRDDSVAEGTETFSLALSKPVGATIATPQPVATILDLDATPDAGVTLSVEAGNVGEGARARFTVRRTGNLASAVTVPYATADATATAPADYVAASGTLTFAPGESVQRIEIATIDDAQYELDETFHLVVGRIAGTCTITSKDPVPQPRGRAARH